VFEAPESRPVATDNLATTFESPQFYGGCSISERVRWLGMAESRSKSRLESKAS
jgi:hypothetical protein